MAIGDKYINVNIYLHKKGFIPAGIITFNDKKNYSTFSYFKEYKIKDYPSLNPATLNYKENRHNTFIFHKEENSHMLDKTFWELLPQPSDWGTQVLISKYPEYEYLNYLEKLFFLGKRTVGGLEIFVKEKIEEENITSKTWLDSVREESIEFHLKNIEKFSSDFIINPLSSYGGARPKCTFKDELGQYWIAKFNLPRDVYNMAIGEHIALEMAKDVGLNCAETKVLKLASGESVFLSKRFDRINEERKHSLSLFALSNKTNQNKSKSFFGNSTEVIKTIINRYSDFEDMDTVNVVVKLLLDLAVNNTDNHLRNLRLILNNNNKWEFSPIYDVVFNPYSQNFIYNPAGLDLNDLYLTNPQLAEKLSKEFNLDIDLITEKIEKVISVAKNWESYCDKYDLSSEDKLKIGQAVNLGLYRKDLDVHIENKILKSKKLI